MSAMLVMTAMHKAVVASMFGSPDAQVGCILQEPIPWGVLHQSQP
jgi:hypothetical protein